MVDITKALKELPDDSALKELVLIMAEGMKQQDELIEHLTFRVTELEKAAGIWKEGDGEGF